MKVVRTEERALTSDEIVEKLEQHFNPLLYRVGVRVMARSLFGVAIGTLVIDDAGVNNSAKEYTTQRIDEAIRALTWLKGAVID